MPSHQYSEPIVETRRSYDGLISTMGPPFRQDDTPYWIRTQVISDKQLNDLFMSQCITWSEYTESCHDSHQAAAGSTACYCATSHSAASDDKSYTTTAAVF